MEELEAILALIELEDQVRKAGGVMPLMRQKLANPCCDGCVAMALANLAELGDTESLQPAQNYLNHSNVAIRDLALDTSIALGGDVDTLLSQRMEVEDDPMIRLKLEVYTGAAGDQAMRTKHQSELWSSDSTTRPLLLRFHELIRLRQKNLMNLD